MPGILTIAKKEFTDHVSDHTFLLCFVTLVFAMVVSAYYQVYELRRLLFWRLESGYTYYENANWFTEPELITQTIITQIITIGILLAIALSFNVINKERAEGSLKVLLSYPIYRDKIILGKLLASSVVIALVMFASMTTAFSIIIYYLSLPITIELIAKITLVTAMATMLLLFFIGLSIAFSLLFNDTSTIIIVMLLIGTLLNSETVSLILSVAIDFLNLREVFYPSTNGYIGSFFPGQRVLGYQSEYWPTSLTNYVKYSPIESFRLFTEKIFAVEWVSETGQTLKLPLELYLMRNLDLIAIQIISVVAVFILCYVLFVRKDEM